MSKIKFLSIAIVSLCFSFISLAVHSSSAFSISAPNQFGALTTAGLPDEYVGPFSQNNISYWNPCEGGTKKNGVSVCGADLPEETIKMLESAGIKEKAQENMERYQYAEEKTGLPWQVLAALHWREGSMGSDQSISNGEKLYDHTNVDGVRITADPNADAEQAAHHLIDMGKSVYGVDVINDPSMDSYGYAFLAYNRGYMYKCNGNVSYDKSPYVMNYYDKDHWDMAWMSGADDTDCNGNILNSVGGKANKQLGALTVLAYLCGDSAEGGSSAGSSGSSSGSSVSGSDITWIGDSYSVQADNKGLLKKNFSGLDIGPGSNNTSSSYIQGSKFVSSGSSSNPSCLDILKGIIDANNLRPYLVFACGTNGGWSDSDITKFQNMLKGKSTKVVVVTSKTPKNDYSDSNKRLKAMANSNDNIYLADWASVYDASYFSGDPEKTHPVTDPGYEKWVGTIKDSLGSTGSNCDCISGQKIADKAKELAWSESDASKAKSPTSEFSSAAQSAGTDGTDDCLTFVKTAIIASGADSDYPAKSDSKEIDLVDYMDSSTKWNKIDTTDESALQPGDVLVSAVKGHGNNHIFIYLGNGKAAAANLGLHYGRIGNLSDEWCSEWGGKTAFKCVDNPFKVYRLNSEDCGAGEFVWYGQFEDKWKNSPFGSSKVGPSGCGPTSFAMLATNLLGKEITPTETAKIAGDAGMYVPGVGSSHAITKTLADHYGLEYEKIGASSVDEAISKINQYLNNGWKIHLSGSGGTLYGGGHYIGIRELTSDGKWLIADSGKAKENSEKPWDPKTVLSGAYLSNLHAIRGTATNPDCNDICPEGNDDSGPITGGLTKEQAEKLAKYYNDGGGTLCGGGTRENCYALSMWWLCNFTDVVEPPTNACSGVGTGAEVVGCLKDRYKLSTGTEPKPYAIFSTTSFHGTIHTGLVVAVESDGSIMTVEAAYPKWSDLGNGLARVWPPESIKGHSITFAYLDGHVDMEKLKEVIGK